MGIIPITIISGLLITSVFTVLIHTSFSIIINLLILFTLTGILIFPQCKSLLSALALSFTNILNSQFNFLKNLTSQKLSSYLRNSRIFIIPVIIVVIFIIIYRRSNPVFDQLICDIGMYIRKKLICFLKAFDFKIIFTFIAGLLVSNSIFLRICNKQIIYYDQNASLRLIRKKSGTKMLFKITALKNEYKASVFLFLVLNILLLVVNVIDIKWVWFGFEWEGQYLKQFVHEGTYLLILSILISIALVLYFFRRNLNFYSGNKFLIILCYLWIIQNVILALSVAIRNFWYIRYFSLAYKRIGVIIFLIMTIYGLYSVFIKVKHKKSVYYLFKSNLYAIYIILVLGSIINWDVLIARYNFKYCDRSFLHLDYMATLSDKTLPYLYKPLEDLYKTDTLQKEKFPFEQIFMTPEKYHQTILKRKYEFITKWKSKHWLSWNYAEYKAYHKLIYNSQKK